MKLIPFEYAARNLGRSPLRLVLSVGGSALVVLLVILASGFAAGMERSLHVSGSDHNVILLGAGSEESVERSELGMHAGTTAAASLRGLRAQLGVPYVSPEIHMMLPAKIDRDAGKSLAVIRGVTPSAFLVHPQVRIVTGRAPEPGRDEIMVGGMSSTKLGVPDARLTVGSTLLIDDRPFTISGRFEAPHTVMDAEVWMPLTDLQIISQRDSLSCVVLTLDPRTGAEIADVEAFAAQRLDLEMTAIPEREYYRKLSDFLAPIRVMVLATAGLIAIGGVFGGLNLMYAAFASRVRELGTLQVLGFRRAAVVVSLLQESILASAAGALVAAAIGVFLLDGIAVRFSMGAFGLVVDGPVLLIGLAAGLGLGVLGAVPPAWRCLRLPIPQALKT